MKKIIIVALCGIGTVVGANGCASDLVEQNDDVVVEAKADTVSIQSGVWVLGPIIRCGGAFPTCIPLIGHPCTPVGSQMSCRTQGTICDRAVGDIHLLNCQ